MSKTSRNCNGTWPTTVFQTLAATDSLERVRNLADEFAAPVGLLSPKTIEFLRNEADILSAAFPLCLPTTLPYSLAAMQSLGQPPRISEALWLAASHIASEL